MTTLPSRNASRRLVGLVPLTMFCFTGLGCADSGSALSDDEGVAPAIAAQQSPSVSSDGYQWPEKCDAVYRITVDNNGKGPKQKIPAGRETHPQIIVDAPWGNEDLHAIAFRPITDNKKVLHHWIAYTNVGYGVQITGWAPGTEAEDMGQLPPDVGWYLPKGPKSIRMDMHYYNLQGAAEQEDGSGFELCVTKTKRKFEAGNFEGFLGIPNIPPNSAVDVTGTCVVKVTEPVFLLSSSAHAHQKATHMKFTHQRGDKVTVLHDAPFNFEEQTSEPIKDGPLELKTGDVIKTTCSFKNTTNRRVTFGESTEDEMCFNFAAYYPRKALSCSGFGGLGS
jgi:hypothetical protein